MPGKRQYPLIYEKIIPIILVIILVAFVVLLLVIVVVLSGLLPVTG